MKRRMILIFTMTFVLMLSGTAMAADDNNSRIQNLEEALANETAARIDKDADLQQQIDGNNDNYSGQWTVNGREYGTCPNPEGAIWSGTFDLVQDEDGTTTLYFGDEEPMVGTMNGNTYSHHMVENGPELESIQTWDTVITFSGMTYSGNVYYITQSSGHNCYLNNFIFGERISD